MKKFRRIINGSIRRVVIRDGIAIDVCKNNVPTQEIAEKIIALCQLYIIAEYYNDGWVPDWEDIIEKKFFALYDTEKDIPEFRWSCRYKYGIPVFKSMDAIEEAYKHNETIFKKALSL